MALFLTLSVASISNAAPALDIWLDFYGGSTALTQGDVDTVVDLQFGDNVMVDLNYAINDPDMPGIGLWKAGFKLSFDGLQLLPSNYVEVPEWTNYPSSGSGILLPDMIQFRGQYQDFLIPAEGTIISFNFECIKLGSSGILFSDFDGGADWAIDIIHGGTIIDDIVPFGELAVVNNTPVPAAIWLLASGLLGIVGIKRKKR